MKTSRLVLFTLLFAALLCRLVFLNQQYQLEFLRTTYRRESHEDALVQGHAVEQTFLHLYQGLRTMARLPSVQQIDRYGDNFSADAQRTIQEIYNNLAANVSLSEVYIVPVAFNPEALDPRTGLLEAPILSFDHLIVGRSADSSSVEADSEDEIPEVEIYEYRLMREQLDWFREHAPSIETVQGLQYPALTGREVITCDNTRFSLSQPDNKLRSGLVYSVPFYSSEGLLKGTISAVILSAALTDELKQPYYAIRNKEHAYKAFAEAANTANFSENMFDVGQPGKLPIFSEVISLNIIDSGTWELLVNKPDALFWERSEVKQVLLFANYGYVIVILAMLAGAVFLWLRSRIQETLRAVLQTAADAIIVLRGEDLITSANAAAHELFACKPGSLAGKSVFKLLDASGREILSELLRQSDTDRNGKLHGSYRELKGLKGDGSIVEIEVAVSAASIGSRRMHTLLIRDISERRRMETQLRQSQKLESIGQLAAGVAHEINTPIQFVGDNTHFLQDEFVAIQKLLDRCSHLKRASADMDFDPAVVASIAESAEGVDAKYLCAEIPKALQQSLEGIERVKRIVGAMKEFSHPGSADKQAIDLNKALESAVVVSTNEWKYVADIKMNFDPSIPLVSCLPGELNQVILNLIVNSCHAIEAAGGGKGGKKGRIAITTINQGQRVEIRITDTGVGIPKGIADKVFDPFFTTKEVGKGTGQGLALARTIIVNKHGGDINFESVVGLGTTFIIHLPISGITDRAGQGTDSIESELH